MKNGKLRKECPEQHLFISMEDDRKKIEAWRVDYNEHRPHTALKNHIPWDLGPGERYLGS